MFGFPIKFVLHFVGWPLGWVLLTYLWVRRERKNEALEDQWILEHILGNEKGSEN